ncbi:UNVERIFIED_CONTAM: AAA-ATPase [Sesamum calycinum]|uniref:AAA-ATPase n=1 Tax=Sesamum calycinum TaxID=2727403 RepID=A0AAW2RSW5_9LAMI
MADLLDFANGESFYQKTGRAWKRGYLLYGPPGTGKSSMIAAMANYLGYDIYDLELTEVNTNSELRKLLMKTSSKSIIVIEDIDCSINLTNRNKNAGGGGGSSGNSGSRKNSYDVAAPPGANGGEDGVNTITLSGIAEEWENGHAHTHELLYIPSLKILLKNYLGYEESDLKQEVLDELKGVIEEAEMTPADISEVLIKNRRDKSKAVGELLEALKIKAEKNRIKPRVIRNGSNEVEDEEQEKRALDSPKEGSDQLQENCNQCDDKEDRAIEDDDDDEKMH